MSPKKIPLKVWAEQHYSPPPSRPTLRKWREEGQPLRCMKCARCPCDSTTYREASIRRRWLGNRPQT